jgi:hypothetical protein
MTPRLGAERMPHLTPLAEECSCCPTVSAISLRSLVNSGVDPFAGPFGACAGIAEGVLVELIIGLSHFQEEGLSFAPMVFVTMDLEDLLRTVGGADPIAVGSGVEGAASARAALKSCAPLGEGRRWAVFLLVTPGGVQFGLFRPEGSPLRPTSFELLRRVRRDGSPIVGLARLRTSVVEVRSSTGVGQFFDLSGAEGEPGDAARVVREFMGAVTRTVQIELRPQLEAFYYRIGVEILTGDHGTLAAVLAPGTEAPRFLSDGIWFREPLDIIRWMTQGVDGAPPQTHALLAYAQLIRRMMVMDGITVFGPDGTVRAYSCFIRDVASKSAGPFVLGGARRRAYELLRSQLGTALIACLYRSQDGAIECDSVAATPEV